MIIGLIIFISIELGIVLGVLGDYYNNKKLSKLGFIINVIASIGVIVDLFRNGFYGGVAFIVLCASLITLCLYLFIRKARK